MSELKYWNNKKGFRNNEKYSQNAAENRLDESRHGDQVKRGVIWSQEDTDYLFELFFDCRPLYGTADSLVALLDRPRSGIETKLQKVSAREKEYVPLNRTDRTGSPVLERDVYIIFLSVNEKGMRNKAYLYGHMNKVLGRHPDDVKSIYKRLAGNRKSSSIDDELFPNNKMEMARLAEQIYERLRHVEIDRFSMKEFNFSLLR